MKIGIIGCGFVGGALLQALDEFHEVIAYDKFLPKYKDNLHKLSECEVIFIAVPTPMQDSGKIDLDILEDVLSNLSTIKFEEKPLLVIRSTITPGTTEIFNKKFDFPFVFSPEFLREKHAFEDLKTMNRIIIGTNNKEDYEKIKSIFSSFLLNAKYFHTDSKTAEMAKYASNTALASQIIMANEIYNICEALGIKYSEIQEMLSLDDRIAKNIKVPGHDGSKGFGGKCFPKDLNAIIELAKEKGYTPEFFEQVWKSNLKFRENNDWNSIRGATSKNNNFKDGI